MAIPRTASTVFCTALLGLAVHGCAPSGPSAHGPAARDTVLAVNGTELFVHTEGSGEPVMVIHGGPVLDHGYLVAPLRPLTDAFRLVYHDQRLSGRSAGTVDSASVRLDTLVADIEAIRTALGLGRVHLLGHSWGGLLAMRYATLHPETLRSLVLVSPMPPSAALWQEEQRVQAEAMTPGDTAGMGALRSSDAMAAGDPTSVEQLLRLSFRGSFHDPSLADSLDFYIADDYSARSRQFGYMFPDLMGYDLTADLEDLAVPTLLIYGEEEPGARIGRDAIVAAMLHTTAVDIGEAGHFSFMERPTEFLRIVRAFLVGVEAGPGGGLGSGVAP